MSGVKRKSVEEGEDTEGRRYKTRDDMWKAEAGDEEKKEQWYKKAVEYWAGTEATYNGVLGGYEKVSPLDVRDSRDFLLKVFKDEIVEAKRGKRTLTVVDCGAGVGRVTKELLIELFTEVDLLEPVEPLLKKAEEVLSDTALQAKWPQGHKIGRYILKGLQEFEPEHGRYDVVWIQWALLYLTDEDAVALFRRIADALKPGGLICVKENICKSGYIVDKEDSSLTRSDPYMLELFQKADLLLVNNTKQKDFPQQLFDVRMYALRPLRALAPPQAPHGKKD